MSEQEQLSRFSATAGQQQQQRYRWNEPLSIEPCSIQHLEDHVSLMQSEIDEYQELLNSKIAQVEHARERIEYLKSIPRASAARAWGGSDIGFARTSASAATHNTTALSFSNAPQNYQHSYNKYSSSSKSIAININNINDGNNSNNGQQQQQQQQHIPPCL